MTNQLPFMDSWGGLSCEGLGSETSLWERIEDIWGDTVADVCGLTLEKIQDLRGLTLGYSLNKRGLLGPQSVWAWMRNSRRFGAGLHVTENAILLLGPISMPTNKGPQLYTCLTGDLELSIHRPSEPSLCRSNVETREHEGVCKRSYNCLVAELGAESNAPDPTPTFIQRTLRLLCFHGLFVPTHTFFLFPSAFGKPRNLTS